jgi:phosphate transport system permease protein
MNEIETQIDFRHKPDDEDFEYDLSARKRNASAWQIIFLAATVICVVLLTTLLIKIVNDAFGYVAMQNKINPEALVLSTVEREMLDAPRSTASEDDDVLSQGIAADPNGVGFFGYAYYQKNQDQLKPLSINGIAPSAAAAENGSYPLARPLYIYTSADVLKEKPQVAAFVNYYLTRAEEAATAAGYFPTGSSAEAENEALWLRATGRTEGGGLPAVDPAAQSGDIALAGSSTVFPISRLVADQFKAAGFGGNIQIDNIGTSAGLRSFCQAGSGADIANASRPINRAELEACRKIGREPIGFRVGTDALAVVTHPSNDFTADVTPEQLRQIFLTAENWSDVNPAWPSTPIDRYIPGANSGTLDFFVEEVFEMNLAELPQEALARIFKDNVSAGLYRRYDREKKIEERTQEEMYALVQERVVEPKIVATWGLIESILNRGGIEAEVEAIPNGTLEFRSWINAAFITNPQSPDPEKAGVRTAILGSLGMILITILVAFPIGVGAAIYLEEYAKDNRLNRLIQTNINNLAGVPSIIYGMLGLTVFVRVLEPVTSGVAFGFTGGGETSQNGRTIVSAALTLALLVLPIIIINSQEAIRAVPRSLRQASFGLGATRWQTVWSHVLPNAMPGILTGTILAVSRAIGETAPLVVIGASTFITIDPSSPFSKFTSLPVQIYQWASRPQAEFRNLAAAAIVVLLIMLLTLNAAAIIMRNRYSRRRIA